ncbi:MAG: MinD/ParA family ATP-binding protein, partial [Acidimicrobiales bacterium]
AAFGPPAVDPASGPPGAPPVSAPSVPGSPLPTRPATRAPAAAGFDADFGRGGPAPSSGFRRLIYVLSGRRIKLGPSSNDTARDQLLARARTSAATGRRRIAMISLKGGVGKTTTTVMLGHTLADVRGDNVIAIDANPDAGNLAQRIRRQSEMSARDLLNATGSLERYADVRTYTSQADSRLEVLAGEADPALSEAFSASDYEHVLAALERVYSIVLTDCGTGILHDAMRAVLWYADQLVVVTSPAVDSANALGQLLEWLECHGHHILVESGIVVVNGVRKHSAIRLEQFDQAFGRRCRAVVRVPYDPALSTGGVVSLEALLPATRRAYLDLAAAVGDGFSTPRAPGHDPSDNLSGGLY